MYVLYKLYIYVLYIYIYLYLLYIYIICVYIYIYLLTNKKKKWRGSEISKFQLSLIQPWRRFSWNVALYLWPRRRPSATLGPWRLYGGDPVVFSEDRVDHSWWILMVNQWWTDNWYLMKWLISSIFSSNLFCISFEKLPKRLVYMENPIKIIAPYVGE